MQDVQTQIIDFLNGLQIDYEYYRHEPAHTIDACLTMPFITEDVTICKNIFLCNRQQTAYYLLLLKPHTPFRTSVVSKALGSSRLSFAPEEELPRLLHLHSGSVSPLGLYYDREHAIILVAEEAVKETARIAFHPCDNRSTVIFTQQTFWEKVLPALGVKPVLLSLPQAESSL